MQTMNKLTANRPKRAKKKIQPLVPVVKIGECVFAAKGKVSFVKANSLPAQWEMASTLVWAGVNPGRKIERSMNISVEQQKKNGILLFSTDPYENDLNRIFRNSSVRGGNQDCRGNLSGLYSYSCDHGVHWGKLWNLLEENPETKLLIILEGNRSLHLTTERGAPAYIDSLTKFAQKKGIAIVLIFNQAHSHYNQCRGPYQEKATNRAFAGAKISYDSRKECYRLESFRAPKGHDFFPISMNLNRDGSIGYHQGIERNRVPGINPLFA